MATERELVKLPSGISLEAKLQSPEESTDGEGSAGLAVLLHPWSWLGGRMEDQYERSLIVSYSRPNLLIYGYSLFRLETGSSRLFPVSFCVNVDTTFCCLIPVVWGNLRAGRRSLG